MNDQTTLMAVLLAFLCKRRLGSGPASGTAVSGSGSLLQTLGLLHLANGFSANASISWSPGAAAPAAAPARPLQLAQPPQQGLNILSLLPVLLCCCLDDPQQTQQQTHIRKYAEGELGEDKSFYFRGPDGRLNLRAQNLALFVQMADGVDDSTWLHHLRAGDYSRWLRDAIKDRELAAEAELAEADAEADASSTRQRIRAAIERRYTGPANTR